MAEMDPKKNIVGTARACTANQRTVNTGYVPMLLEAGRKDPENFRNGVSPALGDSVLGIAKGVVSTLLDRNR